MKKTIRNLMQPFEKFLVVELVWLITKYLRESRNMPNLKSMRWLVRRTVELFISRLKIVRKDNSFANESEIIEKIVNQIELRDNFLVDIGAADGIRQSSTSHHLNRLGWTGALFENNPESFARLSFLYNDRNDLLLCKVKITPDNVTQLFLGIGIPKSFGYLNIDIDSYDLSVIRALLKNGFRPSVISMEINENFPPEFYFEVLYNENHAWQGDSFLGCSLAAADSSLKNFGYSLVCLEYNNAFFVINEYSSRFQLSENLYAIYDNGYKLRPERTRMFPWNSSMEFMHSEIPAKEKIAIIHKRYFQYKDQYLLHEIVKSN